jgi:hypothetical protein
LSLSTKEERLADLSKDQLKRLAALGAQARLEELRREEAAIRQAFPELGRKSAGAAVKRSHMSAAARRAVSERMKKYWAERRKAKAAGKK